MFIIMTVVIFGILSPEANAQFDARNTQPGCPATTYIDENTKECRCSKEGYFYYSGKCRPEKKIRSRIMEACKKVGAKYDKGKAACYCEGTPIIAAKEKVHCRDVRKKYEEELAAAETARRKARLNRLYKWCVHGREDVGIGVAGKWNRDKNGCDCSEGSQYDATYEVCIGPHSLDPRPNGASVPTR